MTLTEFKKAVAIAKDEKVKLYGVVDDSHLHGCGLANFQPVATTIMAVAALIRYQCLMLNGNFDMVELDNLRWIAKHRFLVVG